MPAILKTCAKRMRKQLTVAANGKKKLRYAKTEEQRLKAERMIFIHTS